VLQSKEHKDVPNNNININFNVAVIVIFIQAVLLYFADSLKFRTLFIIEILRKLGVLKSLLCFYYFVLFYVVGFHMHN
jgi:hypothetical protein